MIPILYTADETEFTCNGIGRLTDCISCEVTEECNGVYEAEFVYPVNGIHYEDISLGMILYTTHDASRDPQPFVIYKRSAEIDGHVTFNAHHISYRMSGIVVKPVNVTGTATEVMEAMKTNALGTCPFTFWSDKTARLAYTSEKPTTMREMLGGEDESILELFGGEFEFDKFAVKLWANRGTDHGVSIRYGKNMTDIIAESNEEGAYNAVVPFWSNGEELVTLPEWYVRGPGSQYRLVLAPLDLSDMWDSAPTESELRLEAQKRLNDSQAWAARENIEVEFAQLWQTEEYADVEALQRVVLCDTVSVYYTAAGVETKTKVIKTVYDPLMEQYTSIELGTKLSTLADTISQRTEDSILQKTVTKGFMAASIENATQLITGGRGGYVVLGQSSSGYPDEILIMDTDSTQTAVNVIRMNRNGIGFSTSGYQGPFVSAWTIDGHFNTAFIDVASLSVLSANAGTITAGVLQSSDYSYTSGTYSNAGIIIDLNNKIIRSTKYALLADGSLTASDVHLMGSLVTRSSRYVTAVNAGSVTFYNRIDSTDYVCAKIAPIAWGNDYTNKRGTMIVVDEGATYLALGRTVNGTNVADIVINKSLNPSGYTERVVILNAVRVCEIATFNTYLFCGGSVNACKNVMTSATADKTANRIGIYYNSSTDEGMLSYRSDASGGNVAKDVIIVDKTGAVTYSNGSVSGALSVTGTLTATGILRAKQAANFESYIFGGSSINACKTVATDVTADKTANRIGIYYNSSTDIGQLAYFSNASGSDVTKTVITVNKNGDVTYTDGTVSGALTVSGLLTASHGVSIAGGLGITSGGFGINGDSAFNGNLNATGCVYASYMVLQNTGSSGTVSDLIRAVYSDVSYDILQNGNNGNMILNAASGVLYLGYKDTLGINVLNGKINVESTYIGINTSLKTESQGQVTLTAIPYYSTATRQGVRISEGSIFMGAALGADSYLIVLNGTYGLYASGTISAQTVTQRSDERLKDITTYDERYDHLIDLLEPVSFNWKADEQKTQHVGLGARKTSGLLTELGIDNSGFVQVDTVDGDNIYSINYMELSVMLLHAVQKLREKVTTLERKVAG